MIKLRILIFSFLATFVFGASYSQDLNLQSITPSSIMKRGQVEVKLFNNLYTQQAFFDSTSEKQDIGFRENYFTSANYFLVGVNS